MFDPRPCMLVSFATCLSWAAFCLAGEARAAEAQESVFVRGARARDVTYPSQRWNQGEDCMVGSGAGNRLLARLELGAGDFTIRAEITLQQVEKSEATLHIGAGELGFAANQDGSPMFLRGSLFHGGDAKGVTPLECVIPEGKRFELLARRRGGQLSVAVAGQIVAAVDIGADALGRFGFEPGRARVLLHGFAARGNLVRPDVSADADPSVAGIQPQIDAAIDKGVAYLLEAQQRDGSWGNREEQYDGGQTALCVYTLLKAGLLPSHPAVDRGLRYLAVVDPHQVYSVACLMMALEATHDPRHTPRIEKLMDRLVGWQQITWGYPYDHGAGGWGRLQGRSDLSNTQFAALGLRAAERAGLQVPARAWTDLLKGTIFHQTPKETVATEIPEGESGTGEMVIAGFSYYGPEIPTGQSGPTGSMTAAGVATLEICRQGLGKKLKGARAAKVEEVMQRGLGWLDHNFTVEKNPSTTGWHLYYLYGLERVGSLLGIEKIGTRPWYFLGAQKLIAAQGGNGGWNDEPDTCFAILFLKRATGPSSGPAPEKRRGYYSSEGDDVDVWLRGEGESPLELWIPYFGAKVMEEHARGPAGGPRIARVEYLVDGQVVASVRANPTRAWDGQDFRVWHHFGTPGKHQVGARVHLVAADAPVHAVEPEVTVEAKGFEVDVRTLYGSWYQREAGGTLVDVLESGRGQVQTSSANTGGQGGEKAFDGWHSTRWVCAKDDAAPWISFVPARAIQADTIVLGQASAREHHRTSHALITSVELTLNGKDTYQVDLEPGPLRPTAFTLPEPVKIKRLEIRVLSRRAVSGTSLHCGFSEIGLELCPVRTPTVARDVSGRVTLACATPGAAIHYTLDGSAPTRQSRRYEAPFERLEPCTLQAAAFDAAGKESRIATVVLPEHRGGIYLDRARWRVLRVDSEQPSDGYGWKCIDGEPQTLWHTNYQQTKDPYPHELVIDLRETLRISGVTLLPRQVGVNGWIKDCQVFVGDDPAQWGAPAYAGSLPQGGELQVLRFAEPAAGRYLRLVALSEQAGQIFASLAELDVIAVGRQ